jgi:hypothetical protein
MPKQSVSVVVESSAYELMQSLQAVAVAAKCGGGSSALSAALGQVVNAVAAIQALPADLKDDEAAFIQGAVLGASQLVLAVLGVA